MIKKEFSFRSVDGIHDIYACEYLPEGEIKAVIQVAHGVSEHFGRYTGLCEYMTSRGVAVCGNDHLGHGKSASKEERGFFADKDGWEFICRDIAQLSELEHERHPGAPYFLFGHSMGSFASRTVFMKNMIKAEGYIFSGTGQINAPLAKAGKLVAKRACRKHASKYEPDQTVNKLAFGSYNKPFENRTGFDWISSDSAEVDAYMADPDCGYAVSPALFGDMLGGMDYIRNGKNYATCPKDAPVLLVSGRSDPVGGMGKAVVKVFNAMKKAGINVTLKLYEGRHELLHEPVREEVMSDILSFISSAASGR